MGHLIPVSGCDTVDPLFLLIIFIVTIIIVIAGIGVLLLIPLPLPFCLLGLLGVLLLLLLLGYEVVRHSPSRILWQRCHGIPKDKSLLQGFDSWGRAIGLGRSTRSEV
jgi:membrane protein implicated in regulation of membrane protease activity